MASRAVLDVNGEGTPLSGPDQGSTSQAISPLTGFPLVYCTLP
jgi:hypothetical protein